MGLPPAALVAELGFRFAGADLAVGVATPGLGAIEIFGFFGARREDIGRRIDLRVFVFSDVARGGGGGTVNRAVAEPEKPGLGFVAALALNVFAGPLGVVV